MPHDHSTHFLNTIKVKTKGFDKERAFADILFWIKNDLGKNCCRRPSGNGLYFTICECLKFLADDENDLIARDTANYILKWRSMNMDDRRSWINEWEANAKYLKDHHGVDNLNFRLPVPLREDRSQTFQICRNGLCNLLGIGRKLLNTSVNSPVREHGNKGKTGDDSPWGKKNKDVNESLRKFFEEKKQEAAPFATRLIREETGLLTRDDNPDDIVLPPHYTKHGCYGEWCYKRGWIVKKKSSGKTIYAPVEEYTERPFDEDEWPVGSVPKQVVTWTTFWKYWYANFSNLKVRAKGADTCTDCLILCNAFRNRRQQDDGSSGISFDGVITRESPSDVEDDVDSTAGEECVELGAEVTDLLEKANKHVSQYQVQRALVKSLINLAQLDIVHLLPSTLRRKVITIDMGQNLCLPNFAGNQPGDTYYMSPLTVNLFGAVNNATEDKKEHMNAYIWRESDGQRGQNNIASCILMELKNRGWLTYPNFGELVIIADNCGGQNKNRVVVRLLMWLVEMKYFPKISLVFLVKGHTKNADRLFNLLKLKYHCTNIYTYDELYQNLNSHPQIDVIKMTPDDFYDHLEWQDKYYRAPSGGDFNQTHVFTIIGSRLGGDPTVLLKQDDNEAPIRYDNLMPTSRNRKAKKMDAETRSLELRGMMTSLKKLAPKGLLPIKQVELYKKWGPLMPSDKEREATCPKPSDEILNLVKDEKNKKIKAKMAENKKAKGDRCGLAVMPKKNVLELTDDKKNSCDREVEGARNVHKNMQGVDTDGDYVMDNN